MLENVQLSKPSLAQPRVFISYARSDGEAFATALRKRLEEKHIPLWQDRIGMEGGRDWWLQIVEALDHVEFMILVMTPAALQSHTVRKEWRYARQQGVCVYPVKAHHALDFASLPRWMRDMHWYDLDHEWPKFINDLNSHCERKRVPFMSEDLPPDFVPRPQEFDELVSRLLDEASENPVAITAALRGAGGYGKTTIARALCHDERVQEAFDDGILWATLGEIPSNLVSKVEDLIYILSYERPGFTGIDAATARLGELLADRDILFVIDDVWNAAHLKPFLQGGTRCARLITTRDERTLPPNAQRIQVDAMQPLEAVQLLSAGLNDGRDTEDKVDDLSLLAKRLGEWPLLLTLVNGVLRERVRTGESLLDALAFASEALDEEGLTIFDNMDAQDRSQAVKKTLDVSLRLLSADEQARYKELAVFPEDVDIPLVTLQKLWGATGGLGKVKTEMLCDRLYRISLLMQLDLAKHVIRLHDVVRLYLRHEIGAVGLVALHNQLLDAYGLRRWADLSPEEPYMWEHLADHLINAGRGNELVVTVKDGRYLAAKAHLRGAYPVETDLHAAEKFAPDDILLRLLKRNFVNMSHLLNRCETLHEVASAMHSRLSHLSDLASVCRDLQQDLSSPFLTAWHALPDLPHPALIRTLQGHTGGVKGCAISPSEEWIVSASSDEMLKIWAVQTGEVRLTLRGHSGWVKSCIVSPSGEWILSDSSDGTLRIWDAQTGEERQKLDLRNERFVSMYAISPSSDRIMVMSDRALTIWDAYTGEQLMWLNRYTGWGKRVARNLKEGWGVSVSLSDGKVLEIWDAQTREERKVLRGHTDKVNACAISPSGNWIVSASSDKTLRVWDARTQRVRTTLHGHMGSVNACAISPLGEWIVSASSDGTLIIWDAPLGKIQKTLRGHVAAVNACVVSSSGDWIVSASDDKTLKVWDVRTGELLKTFRGHTEAVSVCAISRSGEWLVSGTDDEPARMWDLQTGKELMRFPPLTGRAAWVDSYAISPSGNVLVSGSEDGTVRVWDGETRRVRLELVGHRVEVGKCAAAVSPSDDWLVSASHDKTLKVWGVQMGEERMTLYGHIDEVNCVGIRR